MGTPAITQQMDPEYNRLGFDAWADNKMVNAIEDAIGTQSGSVVVDHDDCTIKISWNETDITCVIRAYTESGWQTYERQCKR